jgi:phage anti-repressor protein
MKKLLSFLRQNEQALVNGRIIHSYLKAKTSYEKWIHMRIEEYGFIKHEDYISFETTIKRVGGKKIMLKDYQVTLEMATTLCIVEDNAQGKEARLFFIEKEKIARLTSPNGYTPFDFTNMNSKYIQDLFNSDDTDDRKTGDDDFPVNMN